MKMKLYNPLIIPQFNLKPDFSANGPGTVRYFQGPERPITGSEGPPSPPLPPVPTENPKFRIDLVDLAMGDIQANSCAISGTSLFVSIVFARQLILKFPGYLRDPQYAIANAFVFTKRSNDYVGMAFDHAGNLYTTEGPAYGNNQIFRYTGADVRPPITTKDANNSPSPTILGNAGISPSYFANLAFDRAGNLWASDTLNNRIVVYEAGSLSGPNPVWHVLGNAQGVAASNDQGTGFPTTVGAMFSQPEGLDFDNAGNLWVANNNESVPTDYTALVKLSPQLQAQVLASQPGVPSPPAPSQGYSVFQIPKVLGNRSQLGGLKIDRAQNRLFVNEQWYLKTSLAACGTVRAFDLAGLATIQNDAAAAADSILDGIMCPYPGNGGLELVPRTDPRRDVAPWLGDRPELYQPIQAKKIRPAVKKLKR